MKKLLLACLSLTILAQYGCVPKKDNALEEHLLGTWDLVGHCDEFGSMRFDGDQSGTLWVNDECLVGNECLNVLPFDWTLNNETGELRVVYDPSGSALMICSDIQNTAPPSELIIFTEETQVIGFYGYAFEHQ